MPCNQPLTLSTSQQLGYLSYTSQRRATSPSRTCRWTLSVTRTQTLQFHLLSSNATLQNRRCPLKMVFTQQHLKNQQMDLCRLETSHRKEHLLLNSSSNAVTFHFEQSSFAAGDDFYALVQYKGKLNLLNFLNFDIGCPHVLYVIVILFL